MVFIYNPDTDARFLSNFDEQFIDLLDKHGFPIIEEQPKNVHKIGEALGQTLNYYKAQSKQLFLQGRLATANGLDLDNFGTQFGVMRRNGETDEIYRIRLQALFSPKKVTRPHIEESINSYIQTNPRITLVEPWRQVLRFDNTDHFPHGYMDIGDSYMWSPDRWRSGILIVQSGLTEELYGTIENLVAMGVLVLYDQTLYGLIDDDGLLLGNIDYTDSHTSSLSPISNTLYFDLKIPGEFDNPEYRLDYNDFFTTIAWQKFITYTLAAFNMQMCAPQPEIDEGMQAVLDFPWFQFDTVEPGVVIGNNNEFNIDFLDSKSFDVDPFESSFDTNEFVIYNDVNILDSTVVVITGWAQTHLCNLSAGFSDTRSWTNMELVYTANPGSWMNYSIDLSQVDSFTFIDATLVSFQGQSEQSTGEILRLTDQVGMEWKETPFTGSSISITDLPFVLLITTVPTINNSFIVSDSIQEGSQLITLANPSSYKLSSDKKLAVLDTITLNNPYERTLGDYTLRASSAIYTNLSNPQAAHLQEFQLAPNTHFLNENDNLGTWILVP